MRLGRLDSLLVALLTSPIVIGGLFLNYMWGILTIEVDPGDTGTVPIPRPGNRIEVYGTWVRDIGHLLGDFGWNEIHPTVFIHNLSSGWKAALSSGQPPRLSGAREYSGASIRPSVADGQVGW